MNITDTKKALRAELINRRRQIPKELKEAADREIFRRLLPLVKSCTGVFCYVSTEIEVDTRRLLSWCFENNKPVYAPVTGSKDIVFYPLSGFEQLSPAKFGLLEPPVTAPARADANSLCVVPALMCGPDGLRLGYGRGYYDRFLQSFPGRSVIVCYRDFVGNVPAEPHDFRCDLVITD